MMSVEYRFLEPLDVLFLRGNKLFGDPGSFGESQILPWPSVAAGALRSRVLVDSGIDLAGFARGEVAHPELGTPNQPGAFVVTAFHLARRGDDGSVQVFLPLPADLVVTESESGPVVRALVPKRLAEQITSSALLPLVPALAERERGKPADGYWLTQSGWGKYLCGETLDKDDLVKSGDLWSLDHRVGVGLEAETRRAAEGRLFSTQAVAFKPQLGFLVAISGAAPPQGGLVRLGGDGRAAVLRAVSAALPESDYAAIAAAGRCRLVLISPGIFQEGWLPTGAQLDNKREDGAVRFELHGVSGWITCAAAPRAEVVSGWDLAAWQPKPAERVAPTGSIYWLELDADVTVEALRKLAAQGLWSEPCENPLRRAEGYNRTVIAVY